MHGPLSNCQYSAPVKKLRDRSSHRGHHLDHISMRVSPPRVPIHAAHQPSESQRGMVCSRAEIRDCFRMSSNGGTTRQPQTGPGSQAQVLLQLGLRRSCRWRGAQWHHLPAGLLGFFFF